MIGSLHPRVPWLQLVVCALAVAGGVVVAADPSRAPLLSVAVLAVIFVVLAIRDERLIMVAFGPMIWGVLAANKGFATIGAGPVFIMEALLALSVVGVLVNPVTRARIASSGLPLPVLTFALVLGAVDLWRGRAWGVNAVKDSVVAFYAVALILPAALFAGPVAAWRFLRTCALPAVLGSTLLLAGRLVGTRVFSITSATAGALAAVGLIFLVLAPTKPSVRKTTAIGVLALGTVLSLARSVWLGCLVAAILGWIVAARDRGRLGRIAVVAVVVGSLFAAGLSVEKSSFAPRLVGKAESFFFHQTSDSAAPIANSKWRIAVWRQTIHDRIRPNLIAGEGFGRPAVAGTPVGERFNITDPRTQVHDAYLTYLMREGLIGFAAFVILVLGALLRAGRGARSLSDPWERLFALGVVCSIGLYLVDIGFGVILEGPMGGIPFWLLVGCAYVVPSDNALGDEGSPQTWGEA